MPNVRLFWRESVWPPASCEAETTKESIKTKSGKCFCIRVVLSIKLRLIVMSTNLEYRERERQRKRESRATGQRSSTRKGARAREKEQKEMLAATRVRMSDSEKRVNKNTSDIPSIKRVTRKFLEVSLNSCAKQRQRNVQNKCAALAKLLFCYLDLLLFFLPFSLPSPLSVIRFYILFEQTIKIIESFAFSSGYIYILPEFILCLI